MKNNGMEDHEVERSAINTYTMAGAFLGLLFGLHVAWSLIGLRDPGYLFTLAVVIATIATAATHRGVAGLFARAGRGAQAFLAVSGWFVLAASIAALLAGVNAIFPKSVTG